VKAVNTNITSGKEKKLRIINMKLEANRNLVMEAKICKENPLSDEMRTKNGSSISACLLRAKEY